MANNTQFYMTNATVVLWLKFMQQYGLPITSDFVLSGKYQLGIDKPDPKTWKANFRCAMNSLPDIEEVKDKSIKKGTNAFRVYKMLSASERQTKKGKWFSESLAAGRQAA